MAEHKIRCSFCGQDETQVQRLVAGPGVYICGGCLEASVQILSASSEEVGGKMFRVVTQGPNGTIQRCEYGPLPAADPGTPEQKHWLKQCITCGTWNAGPALSDCLQCGAKL